MASVTKTFRWGSLCRGREISIAWIQRWSVWKTLRLFTFRWCCCAYVAMYSNIPTGLGHFLWFWDNGALMYPPAGEAGQECVCGNARVLPQHRMPESDEVNKSYPKLSHRSVRFLHILMTCAWTLGSVPVQQLLKVPIRRPEISLSCWGTCWDSLSWSERRRPKSGGLRVKRRRTEADLLHLFLAMHACPQSPCPHGCLCPSASETATGRNCKNVQLRKPKTRQLQFEVFYCFTN